MVEFTSFNDNDHLTTQSFINLLESVKTGPICNILPDVFIDFNIRKFIKMFNIIVL